MRGIPFLTVPLALAFSLAACSKAPERSDSAPMESRDVSAMADSATNAPGVAITAAPGVAFAYRYAFRLPSDAIAHAQEAHAQACEKLGIARCRITGMRYRLLGENDVEGMLTFKLDPAIARNFGKDGIGLIEAAKGKLVDAEITGTDAGAEIDRLTVQKSRAQTELQRIDAQLARPKLGVGEREELQRQRADLVQSIAANRDSTADQRESLAVTPMTFQYESGPAIRGFDASAPLGSALNTGIGSLQITIAVLLGIIAIFGPPALAIFLGWLALRGLRARFPRKWRAAPVEQKPASQ